MFLLVISMMIMTLRKIEPAFAQRMNSLLFPRDLTPHIAGREGIRMEDEKYIQEFHAALSGGSRLRQAGSGPAACNETGPEASPANSQAQTHPGKVASGHVREMLRLLEEARQNTSVNAQHKLLLDIGIKLQGLKPLLEEGSLTPAVQMAGAVEIFLKQLAEKTSNVNSSTLRTLGLGLNVLDDLCQPGLKPTLLSEPPLRIMVVDDEPFSRLALLQTLKRTLTPPDLANDGASALKLAESTAFDLILMDIVMPGMDGFEICSKLKEMKLNQHTPVVFVTSLSDFDTRSKSILCGGRDLIAKPFLTFELALKALAMVAHRRLCETRAGEAEASQTGASLPAEAAALPQAGLASEPSHSSPPLPAETTAAALAEAKLAQPGGEAVPIFHFARSEINKLAESADYLQQTVDSAMRQDMMSDLFIKLRCLEMKADAAGKTEVAQISSAAHGLLKKLLADIKSVAPSTIHSLVSAVHLLKALCAEDAGSDLLKMGPIKVLAVDDDPVSLRAISNSLQLRFGKPALAADGPAALALAAQNPFDLVLLDVQMPGMDGFEVCANIRASAKNHEAGVVFVTGHDSAAVRARAKIAQANDFLIKPLIGGELNLKVLTIAFENRLRIRKRPAPAWNAGNDDQSSETLCVNAAEGLD